MISVNTIGRWCFLLWVLTLMGRIAVAVSGDEPVGLLNLFSVLFFWGIFASLLYDWSRSRSSSEDRALFLLELADLLRLSIPVDQALAKLAEVRSRTYGHRFATFSQTVNQLSARVAAGGSLASAFEEVSGVPRHWAAYTRFSDGPEQQASLLEELAQGERSSLRLPFLTVLRAQIMVPFYVGVILFLTTYIIPTFVALFEGMSLQVPLLTRLLIGLTRVLTTLHVGGILTVVCLLALLSIPFETVRRLMLRALYYVPGARGMVKLDCQCRAYRLIGAGIKHGVPQSEAIRAAAFAMTIPAYRAALQKAENAPLLSQGLADSPELFAETFRWLIAQGEALENLPDAVLAAAEVASVDLDRRSRRLSSSMDTFVLVGIGIFVGFAVLAVFLPLYQLIGRIA